MNSSFTASTQVLAYQIEVIKPLLTQPIAFSPFQTTVGLALTGLCAYSSLHQQMGSEVAIDFSFREAGVAALTNQIGVYVLCDLNQIPIYVGQSGDGIRTRVRRHTTSARSDIIANRQIDVWEIAWVLAYPVDTKDQIKPLEGLLYHHFNPISRLMNGSIPPAPLSGTPIPEPSQVVQIISDNEILEKLDPTQRLPRQASHYANIVSHFLTVKNSPQVARAMDAHFKRLSSYHTELLGLTGESDPSEE